jgi:hypothetical protein
VTLYVGKELKKDELVMMKGMQDESMKGKIINLGPFLVFHFQNNPEVDSRPIGTTAAHNASYCRSKS